MDDDGDNGLSREKAFSRRTFLRRSFKASAAAGAAFSAGCGSLGHPDRPNIVLIVLDTTRYDHLSCFGYPRSTSPNIDHFAEDTLLYHAGVSTASWTLPAHASLFTGKLVSCHGVHNDANGNVTLADVLSGEDSFKKYRTRTLSQGEITLAQMLRQSGYVTAGVVGGPWLKRTFGLNKGFDVYDDSGITTENGRIAVSVTGHAQKWLKGMDAQKPFFLFLNYFDPHSPYQPPPVFLKEFMKTRVMPHVDNPDGLEGEDLERAFYDAEIGYMDKWVGVFLDDLKKADFYDRSLIIITSDHGELLGEHQLWFHGKTLYEEELHIPVFIKYPKGEFEPAERTERIQLTDIMPLILARLNIAPPPGIQGTSPPDVRHPIIAEAFPQPSFWKGGDFKALYQDQYKFVQNSLGNDQLYDLTKDPHESANLVTQDAPRANTMESALVTYLGALPKPGPPSPPQVIDKETKDALDSLGYL